MKVYSERKGFTLIELMIIVAIIGILSALAIPNFQRFRSKAIQAEARANLASIHTCQIVYFGDYNTFAGGPDAFTNSRYVPVTGLKRYNYIMDQAILVSDFPMDNGTLPAGIPSTQTGFTALAVGNIDNDPFMDTWAVNDQRDIRNQQVNPDGSWGASGDDVLN